MALITGSLFVAFVHIQTAETNEPLSFANIKKQSFDFMVMGDNRPNLTMLHRFLSLANRHDAPLLFHVGDIVHDGNAISFIKANAMIKHLRSSLTVHGVPGNHDVGVYKNLLFFNYAFNYPILDTSGFRSFDSANTHFILLNTHQRGHSSGLSPEQMNWLVNDLNANTLETIVVFMHYPVFPAGVYTPLRNAGKFHDLMTKHNVTLVFSGHEHLFYETDQDGVRYVVTGGAGSRLHNIDNPNAQSVFHMIGVNMADSIISVLDQYGKELRTVTF